MRKLVVAFGILILVDVAAAQPYVPQPSFSYNAMPNYVPPAPPSGLALPGYGWRDGRGDTDWRNNTWREDRFDDNWRNRNWQTGRELQDWRQRPDYSKSRTPNNPFDQGYVECSKGAVGFSSPCANYTTDTTKKSENADEYGSADRYGRSSADEAQRAATRGVANCGHGSVWRRC
jgi:hypothetical protein